VVVALVSGLGLGWMSAQAVAKDWYLAQMEELEKAQCRCNNEETR
jgi:hypothetical protein